VYVWEEFCESIKSIQHIFQGLLWPMCLSISSSWRNLQSSALRYPKFCLGSVMGREGRNRGTYRLQNESTENKDEKVGMCPSNRESPPAYCEGNKDWAAKERDFFHRASKPRGGQLMYHCNHYGWSSSCYPYRRHHGYNGHHGEGLKSANPNPRVARRWTYSCVTP